MKTVMLIAGNIVFWITQNEIGFSTTNGQASIGRDLLLVVSFLMLYRRVEQIAKSLQMIIDHGINVNNSTGKEELIRKNELVYKFRNTRGNESTPQNDIVTEEKSSRNPCWNSAKPWSGPARQPIGDLEPADAAGDTDMDRRLDVAGIVERADQHFPLVRLV